MARSKLPEETIGRWLHCQRWGVCEVGAADMCAVALKTVHRLQRMAAQRAGVAILPLPADGMQRAICRP